MAFSKMFVATLLLLLLAVDARAVFEREVLDSSTGSGTSLPDKKIDCGVACAARCQRSKRTNLCERSCGSCCDRCSCVPPGTYGNKEQCPCYANLTTRGGRPKCP